MTHGLEARVTVLLQMEKREPIDGLRKRAGAYLPHWTKTGATYNVTFRLADSLPTHVLESWIAERTALLNRIREQGRECTAHETRRLTELFSQRVDAFLDAGSGACVLRDDAVAKVVSDSIAYFDGERYELHSWCVMPNHVHALLTPTSPHEQSAILHSWKSFTASCINRMLGRSGKLWQPEYYDHLIRDEEDFAHAWQYILDNPIKAGLKNWTWVGCKKMARPFGQ